MANNLMHLEFDKSIWSSKKPSLSIWKTNSLLTILCLLCSSPTLALAAERIDPYACGWFAGKIPATEYQAEIESRLVTPPAEDSPEYPYRLCIIAELMKRTGDPRATSYYEQAIQLHPEEPALELIYGEYLQWLRGVRHGGLAMDAREHYRRAQEKIANLKAQERWGARNDAKTSDDLKKSLFYLNQANGIGLSFGGNDPSVFFSTITEARNDTVAFDYQWVDSRDLNGEALFAQSVLRRMLSNGELDALARQKLGLVTSNRLRFQPGQLRAFDLTYRYLRFNDSKIPDFNDPTHFVNDVGHEIGAGISDDFQLPYGFDLFVKAAAQWSRRTTPALTFHARKEDVQRYDAIAGLSRLIGEGKIVGEFQFTHQNWDPGFNWDDINSYKGSMVYQSRLFGPNRLTLNGYFVFQDVDPSQTFPDNDNQRAIVTQAAYAFDVPDILFGRYIYEGETFGGFIEEITLIASGNEVKRQEFFGGLTLRRIEFSPALNPFDLTFRSSYYESDVKFDSSQDHTQWRNQLTVVYRLVENPQVQWLPDRRKAIQPALLNLEVPIRHDSSIEGLREFANYRMGLQLKGDFIFTRTRVPFPFYGTVGYAFERFYHLKENFHIFLFRLGTGF
ncbi:tetratricopeptide repeat protein [Candidatus Nitrospira salsa]